MRVSNHISYNDAGIGGTNPFDSVKLCRTLKPKQNEDHYGDDIFKLIY